MAGENVTHLVGNLTADPELRTTDTGKTVVVLNVAENQRFFDAASGQWKDGQTIFMRCYAWGQLGLNAHASLKKGQQVIVLAQLQQNRVALPDGTTKTYTDLRVTHIGNNLQFVTTAANKLAYNVTDPREASGTTAVEAVTESPEAGEKVKVPF